MPVPTARRLLSVSLLVLPTCAALALPASAASPAPAAPSGTPSSGAPASGALAAALAAAPSYPVAGAFALTGHGYGHGRGLSQWGAYGAARQGLTATQILDHYYPGTATADSGNPLLRVLLKRDEGTDVQLLAGPRSGALTVVDAAGRTLALPAAVGADAVTAWRAVAAGAGRLRLEGSWAGAWRAFPVEAPLTTTGTLEFSGAAGRTTLVYPGGGAQDYRGTMRAVPSGAGLVTVNAVVREDYLRGVVPAESPASWPAAALEAQAVAARTYSVSVSTPMSAYDICDDTYCQVYAGVSSWSATGVLLASHEAASTDAAIARTARAVRTYGGKAIFAQFSASNGGWTVAGSAAQPYLVAKPDPYDGVVPNTGHDWTASVTVDRVGAAAGVGRALSLRVDGRDGKGEWGGRTTAVTVVGTTGTRSLTGDEFRSRLGLRSTWWVAAPGTPPGSADLTVAALSGTGSGRVEVHALSRSSSYAQFTQHVATVQPVLDPSRAVALFGSWDGSGGRDLYLVLTSGTGTGRVEVHVLSAASGYTQWLAHVVTPLGVVAPGQWQFRLSTPAAGGSPDLVGVLAAGGASGRVEVHALSRASGYSAWSVHAATALRPGSPGQLTYLVGPSAPGRPAGDLYGVARTGTGSGRTEVHALSEASGYGTFTVHAATSFGPSPSAGQQYSLADVDGDGAQDLVAAVLSATGSGRSEVHTTSGAGGAYTAWLDHHVTGLPLVDPGAWTSHVGR